MKAQKRPFVPRGVKTCPFCGEVPWAQPWHGGGPNKHMVMCRNDACLVMPEVTGANLSAAVRIWNRREPA